MTPLSVPQLLALTDEALDHHRANRFEQAQALYDRILAVIPTHPDVLHMSGVLAQGRGDYALALEQITAAIRSAPSGAMYGSLGMLFHALGNTDQALSCLRQALALEPTDAIVYNNLGTVLQAQGKLPAAMESYLQALANKPDYAHAFNNLGSVAHDLGNLGEAIECYQQALALDPDYAMAHNNYGNAMRDLGRPDEAIAHFERSIALDPGYAMAWNNLGNIMRDQGDGEAAIVCFRKALEIDPQRAEIFSNVLLTLQSMANVTPQELFAEHLRFAQLYEAPLRDQWPAHTNDPDPERRLKIGFMSGDFRDHPVLYFFEPVLAGLDKSRFEIFCYHNQYTEDAGTRRMAALAHHWRPCKALTDAALAELVRSDGIDILIDLAGHTAHNRLLVFARKPAPLQLTWIGYQSTTGLSGMDYRLSDPMLDPPGLTDDIHSETVLRLNSYAPFKPSPLCPAINRLPALSGTPFTFACLNQLAKITDEVIALWSQIFKALPDSRLMLANVNDEPTRQRLIETFERHGVAQERLVLHARMPMADYLALHLQIDLALDSFPFNGGTTTFHSLSMGVPVVALAGKTPFARAGEAILRRVKLDAFFADSKEEYVKRAIAAARDLPALDAIRQALPERIVNDAAANDGAQAHDLDAVLKKIWAEWCARQKGSAELL